MALQIGNKTYDQPADTPEPGDVGDTYTKQEANYREGNPAEHCGLCQNFRSQPPGPQGSECTKVDGNISAYGLSDCYAARINPFHPQAEQHRAQMRAANGATQ